MKICHTCKRVDKEKSTIKTTACVRRLVSGATSNDLLNLLLRPSLLGADTAAGGKTHGGQGGDVVAVRVRESLLGHDKRERVRALTESALTSAEGREPRKEVGTSEEGERGQGYRAGVGAGGEQEANPASISLARRRRPRSPGEGAKLRVRRHGGAEVKGLRLGSSSSCHCSSVLQLCRAVTRGFEGAGSRAYAVVQPSALQQARTGRR